VGTSGVIASPDNFNLRSLFDYVYFEKIFASVGLQPDRSFTMGQQRWLDPHQRQSHIDKHRGSLARHTGQRTGASLRLCVQWQAGTAAFEHRSTQQTSTQTQRNGTSRRGKPWRLLRVQRVLRLAAIFPGLRRALRLGLRVADGLVGCGETYGCFGLAGFYRGYLS
jgi:hypothetical protein